MLILRKVVVGDAERGLVYRNKRFQQVLAPGVHWLFAWTGSLEVVMHNIAVAEYAGKDVDALIARLGAALGDTFVLADLGMQEIGLVLKNGKLEDVLAPGSRKLYWKGLIAVQVQPVSLAESLEIADGVAKRLRQLGVLEKVAIA